MSKYFMGFLVLMWFLALFVQREPKEPTVYSQERIPDLGVEPQPEPSQDWEIQIHTYSSGCNHCLTREELLNNIEDAEMRGMDDDPATLEDLWWELK